MRLLFPTLSALVVLSACASSQTANDSPTPAAEPAPAPAANAAMPTAADGIFTAAQAERGEEQFVQDCAECHASSEFKGRQFMFSWGRRSVGDFYRHVVDFMPEDAPGSLTPQQYVDVVAYILDINDFPAGEQELPADEEVLGNHSLTPPSSE